MKLKQYLIEKKGIKVWLDDERKAPSGWTHIKTTEELIEFYKKNHENIIEMSLDHDLGEGIKTGYDFMVWLEERAFNGTYKRIPPIKVHSANPVGKKRMLQSLKSMERKVIVK